jgi:virginiamycin A acetyltransferase
MNYVKKIRKLPAYVLHHVRVFLWSMLGVPWLTANWMSRRQYLSAADWVDRDIQSYDNGALVWRWSKNESLKIGKYCSIAYGVQFLCGSGHHDKHAVTTFPLMRQLIASNEYVEINGNARKRSDWDDEMAKSKGPIVIGNDVWIGLNSIILSGVKVGDGAIILAGSVVTKDVAPYLIVGGVPARFVENRFDDDIINKLLDIAWWDWPEEVIKERISDFYDVKNFILKYHN